MAYLDGGKYKGAAADVNIWAPRVSDNQEFSAAQIYVGAATNDQDANTLQAGWIAAPSLFGDSWPRLFSYWTTDASRSTGCFNLFCPGYVHTSPSVAIGARITTLSTYGGVQHDGYYEIRQDMDNERWVLRFPSANNEIGYWPMSLFTHLNKAPATKLEYGGTVRNKKTNGVHTGTQMGSGHFAEEGFGKAAHISNIKMADDSNFGIPYSAGLLQTSAKSSNCYNVQFTPNDKRWGSFIYYGGPGKNNNCP
nr:carboxyl-terminal peptidase [Ipomoea batatas]